MKKEDRAHQKEVKWGTFYGRSIPISQISHQHLSNILWYYELVCETKPSSHIQLELDYRFGGIRLPYYPLISFSQEIDALVDSGYTTGELNADIIVEGNWIGKINYL